MNRFFALFGILFLMYYIIKPVLAQTVTLANNAEKNFMLSFSSGINLNKGGGINGDIEFYTIKDRGVIMYGVEFFGLEHTKLEQIDFSGFLQKFYAFDMCIGPKFSINKIEIFLVIGGFLGQGRVIQTPDDANGIISPWNTNNIEIYNDGLVYGYKYKGIIHYGINDFFRAGLGIDVSSNLGNQFNYVGAQFSLLYSINNQKNQNNHE